MSTRKAVVVTAAAAALTALAAACGSAPGSAPAGLAVSPPPAVPLATSLANAAGPDWAVVQMGGSSAAHDNFWELFVRAGGTTAWKLVTPPGVASNGGLVVADSGGSGGALLAGFRPSQDLKFTPLASTADQGLTWSQGALINPGLANVPDSLAAAPSGTLIALTEAGAEIATRLGASWSVLTSRNALARTAAGRACGLTGLTAASFTTAGAPLLAGACSTPGTAGIFARQGGSWRAVGPALPAALRKDSVTVLGLATISAHRTTALLGVGRGGSAGIMAAWSGNGVSGWTLSPELRADVHALVSQSLSLNGAAGLVLAGGHAAVIAGPGSAWQSLPVLPAHTQTLALGPAGQLQALTAANTSFAVWQLSSGAGPRRWNKAQGSTIVIPYGSSG